MAQQRFVRAEEGHATDSMGNYYLHLRVNDLYPVVADTWRER